MGAVPEAEVEAAIEILVTGVDKIIYFLFAKTCSCCITFHSE